MVNTVNVSGYEGNPPGSDAEVRIIRGGPIYSVAKVKAALEQKGAVTWTADAGEDLQDLDLTTDGAITLINQAISNGRFLNSQWCQQKPGGPWAACDSYRLALYEWNDNAHRELESEYYLKFAIAKSGALVFIISCHLSS